MQGQLNTWIHRGKGRYYKAQLGQDLLGAWVLIRAWGSLTSHHGRVVQTIFDNKIAGAKALEDVIRRRLQRGYVRTNRAQ